MSSVAETPDEIARQRDALLQNDVSEWLNLVSRNVSVAEIQNSISWRITRPLRLVRTYQLTVANEGLAEANSRVLSVIGNRLKRR